MRPGNTYGVVAIVRTQAKLVPNLVFACNLRSCCRCTALARHTRIPGMTIAHAPLNFWSGVWRSTPLPVKASDWRTSTPLTPLTINTSSKWFKPSEELMPFRFHRKSTSSLEFYNSTLPRIDVILSSANVIAAPRSDLIGPSRCKRRVTNRMRQPISATCRYDLWCRMQGGERTSALQGTETKGVRTQRAGRRGHDEGPTGNLRLRALQ